MPAQVGNGNDCYVRFATSNGDPATFAISGTNPIVSTPIDVRDLDKISFQLVLPGGTTVDGAWKIEASGNYVPANIATVYGQVATAGSWSDVTALFLPALVPVAHGTAATLNQWTQAELRTRALRLTFTPTAGSGNGTAITNGKAFG
ncbi:MAG TPA: hypothetical protein VLZ78_02635 [Terrimesophilobacter sp.]|nr:hypothetical protein [Terrimesophilobacter sp.]